MPSTKTVDTENMLDSSDIDGVKSNHHVPLSDQQLIKNDDGEGKKVPRLTVRLKVRKVEDVKEKEKEKEMEMDDFKVKEDYNIVSSNSNNISSNDCKKNHYGTFIYRPFKLFPFLPQDSHFRVLIPANHLHPSNPALKLNYFWRGGEDDFTDDSDLVCMLVYGMKEEGEKEKEKIWGKRVLVQIKVTSSNQSHCRDKQINHRMDSLMPRVYPHPHDGNHIKIVDFTVDPQAVHSRGWKKRRKAPTTQMIITTPPFKTTPDL